MFVSKTHEVTATLAALSRSHAVIAFKMDGTIITANENFLAVTGYRLADIRGQSHAIFVAANERQGMAYQRFWDGLKRGVFQAGEYHHIGKHGRDVWVQATYTPILRRNGKPFKVIALATDITARIRRDAGRDGEGGASRLVPEALALGRDFGGDGAFDVAGHLRQAAVWRTEAPLVQSSVPGRSFAGMKGPEPPAGETVPAASEPASRIGDVIDMINRIAAENNLAALRATIEAARAGEATGEATWETMTAQPRPRSQARRPGRMA
jgi:methyl-accepting chemotaxis protein